MAEHHGHKIAPERAGHLDGRLRRFLMPPEKLVADLRPRGDEIWAEIGAGTGFFVVPLAAHVEQVYALDVSEQMLSLLRENISRNQVSNVEALQSEESRLPLPDASVDAVLLALVLHEVEAPERFLAEVTRITRPGGRLTILEFTQAGSFGPPKGHRLTRQQIDDWVEAAGYSQLRSWNRQRRQLAWKYFDLIGLEYKRPQ